MMSPYPKCVYSVIVQRHLTLGVQSAQYESLFIIRRLQLHAVTQRACFTRQIGPHLLVFQFFIFFASNPATSTMNELKAKTFFKRCWRLYKFLLASICWQKGRCQFHLEERCPVWPVSIFHEPQVKCLSVHYCMPHASKCLHIYLLLFGDHFHNCSRSLAADQIFNVLPGFY